MAWQQTQYEREEDALCEDLNNGLITISQYKEALRELNNCYREDMENSCKDAYEREMDNWR